MKAVIQRVTNAKVTVDDKVTGEIGLGFLVLLGVTEEDTEKEMKLLAKKGDILLFKGSHGMHMELALEKFLKDET